jgi:hypothetical protein
MARQASMGTTDAWGLGTRWIRRLVGINLGLVALQPLSAGFLMSGHARALTVHAIVAQALQLVALIQAITAIVLWRRHRVPIWVAGASIGLFVIVFLQVALGYRRWYWLHVPIGVALVVALQRQASSLDALTHDRSAAVTAVATS